MSTVQSIERAFSVLRSLAAGPAGVTDHHRRGDARDIEHRGQIVGVTPGRPGRLLDDRPPHASAVDAHDPVRPTEVLGLGLPVAQVRAPAVQERERGLTAPLDLVVQRGTIVHDGGGHGVLLWLRL